MTVEDGAVGGEHNASRSALADGDEHICRPVQVEVPQQPELYKRSLLPMHLGDTIDRAATHDTDRQLLPRRELEYKSRANRAEEAQK